MKRASVVIAAGGTGGHVVPGIAVAEALGERGIPVLWVGTARGLESRLVPAAGIAMRIIDVAGLRGKRLGTRLLGPLKLVAAIVQSLRLLHRERVSAVLGMGGFVSGPVALAALLSRRPLFLHEQNAVAGLTNRKLARHATRVFAALPDAFAPAIDATVIGNPVRRSFRERFRRDATADAPGVASAAGGHAAFGATDSAATPPTLLVVGGSRGARSLNRVVPAALKRLGRRCRVLHQCGDVDAPSVEAAYAETGSQHDVTVCAFIDDMATAYGEADLAICRAGAMTVTELAAAALPAILVPFPYAVDDHQTVNARCLSNAGAAVLLPEAELDAERLARCIAGLLDDPGRLAEMHARAAGLFRDDAADVIADAIAGSLR